MNSIRSVPARPFRCTTPLLRRSTPDRILFIIGNYLSERISPGGATLVIGSGLPCQHRVGHEPVAATKPCIPTSSNRIWRPNRTNGTDRQPRRASAPYIPGVQEIKGAMSGHNGETGVPSRAGLRGAKTHTAPYSSNAIRTNWLRVRTPVFTKSCWSADFTEASEIFMCAAISLLLEPANTPLSTSRSRSLNWVLARLMALAFNGLNQSLDAALVYPCFTRHDFVNGLNQ